MKKLYSLIPLLIFGLFSNISFSQNGDCSSSGTYTYAANENASDAISFVANNTGDYITLTFTSGSSESGWDYWFITDAVNGAGNVIATGDGSILSSNGGVFESTTGEISFYVDSDGSVNGTTFTYSLSCAAPPSCIPPTGLTASNVTNSTADISWTAGGTETSWNFDYGPAGYTQGQGTSTIADNPNSLFVGGTNAPWIHVHPMVTTANGVAVSGLVQTYFINVTSLPASGAKARLIKSTANGGAAFSPSATGQALVLGANTFTASAVSFNRYVKIQFNNDQFEFDSIAVNGTSVYTSGSSVSTTSASLSGLTSSTNYDAYVQSDCGSGDVSGWVGPFSFTTLCSSVTDFTENFDAATTLPNCFETIVNGSFSPSVSVLPGSTFGSNGSNFVRLRNYGTAEATLVLPEVTTLGSNYRLTFSVNNYINYTGHVFNVGTVDANNNFTSFQQITIASNATWETQTVDFSTYSGTDTKVAIAAESNPNTSSDGYYTDLFIDDVVWEPVPNCFVPTALSASNIDTSSADFSWTGTGATSYNIEFGTNGYTRGTGGTASTVSASATIADNPNSLFLAGPAAWPHVSNLALTTDGAASQAAQTFTINVTSLPAGGTNWRLIKQNQGSGASFIPTGSVGQPLVLGVNTLTAPASTWNRYVKAQFKNNAFEFDAISINGISVYSSSNTSFTGLTPQTQYDVYVQSDCGSSNGTSNWSGPLTFGTACAAASAPAIEDFDAGFPVCWSQSTADDFNWTLDASGTPSPGTGPSDDITGGGNYMFIETSGGTNGNEAVLLSQEIDLSTLANGQLRFFSHMYGSAINTLTVDISLDAGATFTQVFTKTGGQGNQWNEELVDLSNYSGTVLFKITASQGTSYTGDIAIDDFEIREAPACPAPTSIVASNLTATSADLSWTAGGTETSWNIEYDTTGYTLGALGTLGTASTVSAASATINTLAPYTTYDFYVQADCGSGDESIWVGPFSFTTPGPGDCSSSLVNYNYGNLQGPGDAIDFVANNPGDYITLTFTSGATESCCDDWYITDGVNGGGNVIESGSGNIVTTSTYGGVFESSTGEISFYVDSDGSVTATTPFNFSASCAAPPACVPPNSLAASNITPSSADITWTAGGTETAWNYEYGLAGYNLGSGNSLPLSAAAVSLSNLLANTSYHVYVQADCGRGLTSAWAGPFTFRTPIQSPVGVTCISPNSSDVVFSNDLETSNNWPAGNFGSGSTSASWNVRNGPTGSGGTGPSGAHSGSNYFYFETSGSFGSWPMTGAIVSPMIDLTSALDDAELSFWIHAFGNDIGTLNVGIGNSDVGPFTTIFTNTGQIQTNSNDAYQNVGINLSNYLGQQIYLQFDYTSGSNYQGDIAIDLIEVSSCVACSAPSSLTASNITNNSANFNWTSSNSSFNFEYGPQGFAIGTGTSAPQATPDALIIGLSPNTQYDVYVQTDCGSGSTSSWVGPYTFTTECDIVTTFPYTMDFENGFGCWDVLDLASANTWQTNSGSGVNASISARIQYSSVAHDDHLISPKFSVTANSSRFSFNARNYIYLFEKFDVLVSTTGKAAADFTDTLVSGVIPPTSYDYYQYDLSAYIGQDVYVSIHATETNQYYLYVDDVTIDEFISKTIIQSETSCDSYTWSVNGTSYTSDTNLTVFSPAVDVTDSDSTFILNLTVNSSTSSTETITACDSLVWYGNTYFADNSNATTTLQTSLGCDSIVTLNLTINNSNVGIETVVACDSSTWNGTTYTTSGNYSLTGLTNNVNCDSTSNLVLTVNYSSSSLLTTTACNTFTWKGSTFTSSGVYVAPAGTNFSGCPQVDSLDLTITTIATSDTQTVCDSYTWDGNAYTTSGTYYSSSACVDTLYLTVNASSSSSSTVAACDSSVWNGITYFTSGTYNVFTTNAAGCDSTATLNLTVGNSASNSVTVSECDSYNWNGTTYTSSGVYPGVFQTSTGCDSTVNLVLTINSSSNQSVTVFSCDEYTWDGVSYTASGDYTNNYTSVSGCDSTVTLVLTLGTTAAPFTEGFDINFPNCWSQPDSTDGEDALDWTRNSFATLSQGTGPSDDVIGGGHYMYIESSSPAQHGDNAIMYSNFIDISSLTNPELRFFSHMYGESTGSLTVEIQGENDTVPTTIFSKSGDHGDLWVQERVIFGSTSNRVKFKITGVLDSNSLGAVWAGDMAIDEFGVREAVPNDLAIIAAAVNSDCELTDAEEIELWVVNNGLVDQADFKLSYSINGGAPVLDSIIQFVNIGDTLRHVFTTTADMSMDGIYDIDFACILAIDADATDNVLNFVAENYTTPADAVTEGDTICFVGDFGQISAISDGWIYWYDSLVGGSLVGEKDTLFVSPSATTSYFAEVSVYNGFEEDFESYSPGDLIAQTSNDWNTWSDPNGGADDDAEVTDFVSAGGSNSLYLNDDNSDDIVLPLGKTYSSGTFNFETDMYIETEAYFNFQEGVVNGDAWAFDLYFTETEIKVEIDDSTVLTVAYNPNNPLGAPIWFNFSLEAEVNGQWKMFKDGVSIGAFTMSDPISSVNFWASTGNNYYIDNVKWSAWGGDACRSLSRTEAVVVLDSCNTTSVSDVSFENLKIYPNPNNGSFTIANSELINSVVIMDLQGKVVYRNSNLNLYNLNVNLENLDRGMYMINIISENEITTKSIILN